MLANLQARELQWNFTPRQALAAWRSEVALLALTSGDSSSTFDQWTILAPRRECTVIDASQSTRDELLQRMRDFAPQRNPAFVDSNRIRLPFVGGWIGFVGYECATLFEPRACAAAGAHQRRDADSWPNAILCRVPRALVYCHALNRWFDVGDASHDEPTDWIDIDAISQPTHLAWESDHDGELDAPAGPGTFERMVERVREYICAGDIFQANITQPFRAMIRGSVRGFAIDALAETSPRYGAYLELDDNRALLSFSPELFLALDGGTRRVITRPMKGTRPSVDDAAELIASEKDAAELHMIVDLMRSDLGRVCEIGSVHVDHARMLEHHPTVLQAVAEISGILESGRDIADLFVACFPPGSVTGAPKVRAMQIIDELEVTPRGPYCGAVGLSSGCGSALMSVAIRTAQLTRTSADERWTLDYHAGCGIVAESDPIAEARECLSKTRILCQALAAGNTKSAIASDCA